MDFRTCEQLEVTMKDKPLTVTFHLGGKQIDKLMDDEKKRIAQRISIGMTSYYEEHPSEINRRKLC